MVISVDKLRRIHKIDYVVGGQFVWILQNFGLTFRPVGGRPTLVLASEQSAYTCNMLAFWCHFPPKPHGVGMQRDECGGGRLG